MGIGRGASAPPRFFNFQQKKVVFLVLRGGNQISPLLAIPVKNIGKIP